MGKFREVYITIGDFAFLQSTDRPYEGFIIGLGYAFVYSSAVRPPDFNGYSHAGDVPPQMNRFRLVRNQYVDNSPEMIERSLNGITANGARIYTVRQGDTLTAIAREYRVSVEDLIKWNKLSDPDRLQIGQKLIVSEGSRDLLGDYLKFPIKADSNRKSTLTFANQIMISARKKGERPSPASTVLGTVSAIGETLYYSKKYGIWMGRNFKIYSTSWGGNGSVGGKLKFGKKVATGFKWAGRAVGAYNAYQVVEEYTDGNIDESKVVMELSSNAYATFGGIYGAAWGLGWELGRQITYMDAYQEFKFNMWYHYVEGQIGKPSIYNEDLWMEIFYKNYKP